MSKVAGTPTASIATSTPAPFGERHDVIDSRAIRAVDERRRPELFRDPQPVGIEVDHQNRRGRIELRGQQRGQPDRTRAHDRHRVTRLNLAVQHAALEGGRENVAEHHERFFIRVLGQVIQARVGMRDAHVLRLGAVDRVAENPSARPAVRIHALAAQITLPARADARDEHPIAFAKRRHERTDGLDDADAFVAENPARGDRRDVALHDVKVRTADRRRGDPHHRIPGVSNERPGFRLPRALAGTEVDQRLHRVCSSRPRSRRGQLSLQ